MNVKDTNVKLEDLNRQQLTKTTSRLRNVSDYLLNKFTKGKTKQLAITATVSETVTLSKVKKRRNFLSIFETKPTAALSLVDKNKSDDIDSFDKFVLQGDNNNQVNNESVISTVKSLDNSMAKAKIQAASKRKLNPKTNKLPTSSTTMTIDSKLETINESIVVDLKLDTNSNHSHLNDSTSKTKSNESLDETITKAVRNMNQKKALKSTATSPNEMNSNKIIESFVKISNELNLDQEKTLASITTSCLQKSSSCSSDLILMDTNNNETNLHIYDNLTIMHHYDTSMSDDVSFSGETSPSIRTNKVELFTLNKSSESHLNVDSTTNYNMNKTNRISELKSKFSNEPTSTNSNNNNKTNKSKTCKSFETLDTINNQKCDLTRRVSQENEIANRKLLTYSKSLHVNSNRHEVGVSGKPSRRVANIINDLNNSNEPYKSIICNNRQVKNQICQKNENESKGVEKGKVKLIVKGLEK